MTIRIVSTARTPIGQGLSRRPQATEGAHPARSRIGQSGRARQRSIPAKSRTW